MNLKKKKICIITTAHHGHDARIYRRQARSLSRAGYSIVIMAPEGDDTADQNISHVRIRTMKFKWGRLLTNLSVVYRARQISASVYHFHDPDFMIFALFLKVLTGRPVVFDVHEDYSKVLLEAKWLPERSRRILSSIYTRFEKICSYGFNAVITATEHIASKFNHRSTTVIHNYPAEAFSDPGGGQKQPYSLVYLGGLTEERGVLQMLKAAELLREKLPVTLDIYGKFTEPSFEKRIRSNHSHDWITFHGFIDNKAVYDQLRSGQIGILPYLPIPNHIESLPTKLFEYMMVGLPVACSDFDLWKKIVTGNNLGCVFNPESPQDIRTVLYSMLSDVEKLQTMSGACRKMFTRNYSWEKEEGYLLSLYRALVM